MLPVEVATIVVISELPLRFSVGNPTSWTREPVPARAVETLNEVRLFSTLTPFTVKLGMVVELEPSMAWLLVANIYTPVPAVKVVPLLIRPPLKPTALLPELFQTPPLFMVTRPPKVLRPVALVIFSVSEILLVPFSRNWTAPMPKVPGGHNKSTVRQS